MFLNIVFCGNPGRPSTRALFSLSRISLPCLRHYSFPDTTQEFIIQLDASYAYLKRGFTEAVLAHSCKRFIVSQQRYSTTEEYYGVVRAIHRRRRGYLWGRYFTLGTDRSVLRCLHLLQDFTNMLSRWVVSLQAFDFTVANTPGNRNGISGMPYRLFAFEQQDS